MQNGRLRLTEGKMVSTIHAVSDQSSRFRLLRGTASRGEWRSAFGQLTNN